MESVSRIEPARLDDAPTVITDVIVDLASETVRLGRGLHATTAANLADLVRMMNTYYSNLIEGHDTQPREIARALAGDLDRNEERRNLQLEATAHMRVQAELDRRGAAGELSEPATAEFLRWLHLEFYRDAPEALRRVGEGGEAQLMIPGEWRSLPGHDNAVGRHVPPSSARVDSFMRHFQVRFQLSGLGKGARILAIPAAHHRFNYIHPFPDGNGRVSRLMSHAMGYAAGIDAHGLWSASRGLARGLASRLEYKQMMDLADTPRQGDLDGRGNLSEKALIEFTLWFLKVCLDQVRFMAGLFEIDALGRRLKNLVVRSETLKPESSRLLEEALIRGEFERGFAARITGLPERTARRVLNDTINAGLLASRTPKGPVSLRFPESSLEILFPRLYPET